MTDMVDQLTEEMKSMRNHFIVVTLHAEHVGMPSGKCKPPTPDGQIHDPDELVSNDLVDSRATFLEKCQACAALLRPDRVARRTGRAPPAPSRRRRALARLVRAARIWL